MSINHYNLESSSPPTPSGMDSMHRRKRLAVRDTPHLAPQPSTSLAPTGSFQGASLNSTAPAVASFPSGSSYSSSPTTSSPDAIFDMQLCIHLRDAGKYVSFSGRRKALPNILDLQR